MPGKNKEKIKTENVREISFICKKCKAVNDISAPDFVVGGFLCSCGFDNEILKSDILKG